MSLKNPHQETAHLGDLVVAVTANGKYTRETGMRLWFECEVATVVSISETRRIKAILFARGWSVERRADLANLVALVPFPSEEIDVPLAMMAARENGKPFGSLEEVRAAVRPFVLVDVIERGYNPAAGEGAPEDDSATEAFVDVADAERYAQRDEYVNAPQAVPDFKPGDLVNVCDPKHKHFGTRGTVVGYVYDPAGVVVEYDNLGNVLTVTAAQLMHHGDFVKQPDGFFKAAEAARGAKDGEL